MKTLRKKAGLIAFMLLFLALLPACANRQAQPSLSSYAQNTVVLPGSLFPDTGYMPPSFPPRYFAETTLALKPGPDYGRIWPYIGGYAELYWMQGELIGLCDDAGKIICDPVYSTCSIIEQNGKRLYVLQKNRRGENGENVSSITLAGLDGSWASEFDGIRYRSDSGEVSGRYYFWRPVVFYEYISVCRDGKWGVIDYDGQEILPCVYHEPVCFSEGLAAVLSDDQKTYSYIDISGNPVLGPYETPPIQYTEWHVNDNFLLNGMFFLEDRVRFRSGTKYGVHDRTGAVIVPAQYDYVTSFYLGMAKTDLDGQIGVIDKNGGFLIEPGKDDIMPHDEGTVILSTQSGQYMFNISTGERSLWISRDDLQYAYADGKLTVTWSGGELTFPGNDRAELLDNGNLAVTHTEEGKWEIVNPAGYSVAGPFKGRVDNVRDGIIYVLPPESDDRYGSFVDLYTSEGVYLPGVYVNIIPLDGRFLVRQHNSAGLMDASGNWVIKVPLYDYKPD